MAISMRFIAFNLMKRRKFIKTSLSSLAAPLINTGCNKSVNIKNKKMINGFIFSDAHIGWRGGDQPTLAEQKNAIKNIASTFKDLDLVFDTGDVHHGNLKEAGRRKARAFWLKEMAGKFPQSLFHYIPGNHELGSDCQDAELRAGELGSFVFRPYYSFDYKGIHFVSLPQLQDTILISQESINWLKIDLRLNQNKTTVVLSHNSLSGTTYNDNATGYRVTVNSQEVSDVLNEHGNVIAWFHGHNHQFEIVTQNERLYVSNGRIGGFNPPSRWGNFGQGHLGGVYFEIDSNGLTVKCFSATENDFFENLGQKHLTSRLNYHTSFNPISPVNYYFGHGLLHGQNKYVIHNHYLSQSKLQATLLNNPTLSINANHDLRFDTVFRTNKGLNNKLIGFNVKPSNIDYRKAFNGVRVFPDQNQRFFINFPIELYKFDNYLSRSGYYRCGLGSKYLLDVECESNEQLIIDAKIKVLDINHKVCYQSKEWISGRSRGGVRQFRITIPESLERTPHDHRLYLFVSTRFKDTSKEVLLKHLRLRGDGSAYEKKAQIMFGDQSLNVDQGVKAINYNQESGNITVADIAVPKTLYIKIPHVQWQVRNATATIVDNNIKIHRPRHDFAKEHQVIIAPTAESSMYVNRLVNVFSCEITYVRNKVIVKDIEGEKEALITIFSRTAAAKTKGLSLITHINNQHTYQIMQKQIELEFDLI